MTSRESCRTRRSADPAVEESSLERIRSLTSDLQQVLHGLSAAPSGSSGPGGPGSAGGPGRPGAEGGDDVIDAEFRPE
ncbi:hypothetical protein CLM62_01580 [Streptomyces sp. SA15]|uniref:hypothetical protein n=1 Tax=Streptomyces sp. SA15 TaxID=934019 RepID=UPI000BAF739F|nr:hypothetical protein [Streptomyces sp. SA15]PAZ17626.1 hypothetical protein CLM62_01580 [Streptomyces sp. SA15]